jgi:hypothetical protein
VRRAGAVTVTRSDRRQARASPTEGAGLAVVAGVGVTGAVSTGVAATIHPIFRNAHAEYLMFTFPELTFCAMGMLVWIGGYTGYRLLDLLRFRSFADRADGDGTAT